MRHPPATRCEPSGARKPRQIGRGLVPSDLILVSTAVRSHWGAGGRVSGGGMALPPRLPVRSRECKTKDP
jgi:hypothetical protein